ncbi:DNA gyrase inhibitor YacG [Rhodomicrobium vannielii ATCC 17100]|uniref:DNA gyrase inhibitor YacG n=1 Tax=Rhodomicrobium vannielii TaxID=1069 RepID=UPI0019181ED6|nr:DNA gyrase inhibitor YacG [Rhodomicrobium vannielii]MBJ7533371.1 DNA gyrase inhibitor YacG [Rhodomicrobium vannielii ATCC 17100]
MGDRLTGDEDQSSPPCVICGLRPQVPEYRPFCSRRCADVDLHRWLGGVYAIPVKPEEEEDEGDATG